MAGTMSSPKGGNDRVQWIDNAKAVAAWMVVTSHLLRQGVLTDLLAAMSVSMFFMLAGITMHSHQDLRQYLRRLVRRIVVPYLAVGLISIAVYRVLGSYAASQLGVTTQETTLVDDLVNLLYGSSVGGRMKWNESLWFLPCYCLMILMAELIERVSVRHRLVMVALYVGGGALGYCMIAAGITGLPWHLETALLVLPLCGFGRLMRTSLIGYRTRPLIAALLGVGWFGTGLQIFPAVMQEAGSLSLRAPHIGGAEETYWFLIATSAGLICLIWGLTSRLRIAVVPYVGMRSLDIVLWNKFPVLFLQVVVPLIIPGFDTLFVGGTDPEAVLIAAILAVPCIAACFVWTAWYKGVYERLRPREQPAL